MKKVTSDNFNVFETDLSGNIIFRQISSSAFMYESGRKLLEYQKQLPDKFPELLHEYATILKHLVKNEMLHEMMKRIDNIDTFYN